MSHTRSWVLTAAALLFGVFLWTPLAGAQEFKGQVKVGIHKVKLEAGKLYQVVLDSPKNLELNLDLVGVRLLHTLDRAASAQKSYVLPAKTDDFTFVVSPQAYGFSASGKESADYTLKLKAFTLADKPLLEEKTKLAADDPKYKAAVRDWHYKGFKVPLKSGQVYIIDMVRSGPPIDPYLYLEGPDGKIVTQDDDSGGDLNARIVYAPTQDGEFRIIATSLTKELGDFTLTVRQTK